MGFRRPYSPHKDISSDYRASGALAAANPLVQATTGGAWSELRIPDRTHHPQAGIPRLHVPAPCQIRLHGAEIAALCRPDCPVDARHAPAARAAVR